MRSHERLLAVLILCLCALQVGAEALARVPWSALSPAEQDVLGAVREGWDTFTAERQTRLREAFARFRALPPAERRTLRQQWQDAKPEERRALRRSWRERQSR